MRWLIVLLLLVSAARAEIMVGESLEWLVDSSPQIGLYTVLGVKRSDPAARASVRLSRQQNLRGGPPVSLDYRLFLPPEAQPSRGEPLMVFLQEGTIHRVFRLDHPVVRGEAAALTSDFQVLKTGTAIREAVRRRLKTPRSNRCQRVEVPWGTPAAEALYSGSSCYLLLPSMPGR